MSDRVAGADVAPSALDAALPFVATAGLLIVGSFCTALVLKQMRPVYAQVMTAAKAEKTVGSHEDSLTAMGEWIVDGSQLVTLALGPMLGLALLAPSIDSPGLILLYSGAIVATFVALAAFLTFVDPHTYPQDGLGLRIRGQFIGVPRIGVFSPVTILAILGNAVAAALAASIAADVI